MRIPLPFLFQTYKMESPREEDPMLDLEMVVAAPGYVSRTPTGIEDEGFNYRGSYNPQTMGTSCRH